MVDSDDSRRGASRSIVTRRQLLAAAGASALGGLAGCSGSGDGPTTTAENTDTQTTVTTTTGTTTTSEPAGPVGSPPDAESSHHSFRDGFADPAPWLEPADQVTVRKVTEPTRRALNLATIYDEPTVVVFETSGTIDLENRDLTLTKDKTWIAGQTAPSPGITLTRGSLKVEGNDCVIQHIRSKPGDGADYEPSSMDAIGTQDGTENNVIDHCTAAWSTDEALSVGYTTNNTTVTNSLITEPLHDSLHPKGPHGYGSLTGNDAANVFYAGNVWAHSYARNPRLKTGTKSVVANNVMYQYDRGVRLDSDSESAIVGNAFIDPVDTSKAHVQGGLVYADDNVSEPAGVRMTSNLEQKLDSKPLWPEGVEAMAGADVEAHNLTYSGARPADRSAHDQQVIEKVRNRSADDFIDSQEEVGGYPELAENTRELTVPTDLRNWLEWHALAVENPEVEAPTA